MEQKSTLGSGPETVMPTYAVWLAQENRHPMNVTERQACYKDYIKTFSNLIVGTAQISEFEYIKTFFQTNVNIKFSTLKTDQDCDAYELALNDLTTHVNDALGVEQHTPQQAPQGGPTESIIIFIPIEASGRALSGGGQKFVKSTFNDDLGLKCLDHYSALHIVVDGKLTITSAGAVKKGSQDSVVVYLTDVAPSGGSIAKSQAGLGGLRLDLQAPFTLQNSAGGQIFQNLCGLMTTLLKNKQMEPGMMKSVQTFCNTCLAFNGPIQLANWQVQVGTTSDNQESYTAVLMCGGSGIPLLTFIQAHFMSARRTRRCFVCIIPPEVVAALRAAGLLDDVLRIVSEGSW